VLTAKIVDGVHKWTPTLAASFANSAAALPPKAGEPAPWYGQAALMLDRASLI